MGSSRLPGKTMMDLSGVPVLGRVLERVQAASSVEGIVVATTEAPLDDPIVIYCEAAGVPAFRGKELDVLDRFRSCASSVDADSIVRVTADCPLLVPDVVDFVVDSYRKREGEIDYAGNVIPPTFPDGLDVEVFSREALERAWKLAEDPLEREHVTLHFWRNTDRFRLLNVRCPVDRSSVRWTLDTQEDLEAIRAIFRWNAGAVDLFDMERVLERWEALGIETTMSERNSRLQNSLSPDELDRLLVGGNIESVIYSTGQRPMETA
jgi:spore coat polysaccharide biosynthesis protein SpsF